MKTALLCSLLLSLAAGLTAQEAQKPNIVVFLADDMDFADLGCYGSEIQTPNLDRLARNGVRFSQFCNTARCCPSRASLMTGIYAHRTGLGWMTAADLGRPAYSGQLAEDTMTIAEALGANGYATAMTGKWHLTFADAPDGKPNPSLPLVRGFQRFYGSREGAKNYFKPKRLYDGERQIKKVEKGYYYTRAITKRAAKYVQSTPADKPLFLYVAFFAPHQPWQAPTETIAKYAKTYDKGWDELRKERLRRQQESGLMPKDLRLAPRDRRVPA